MENKSSEVFGIAMFVFMVVLIFLYLHSFIEYRKAEDRVSAMIEYCIKQDEYNAIAHPDWFCSGCACTTMGFITPQIIQAPTPSAVSAPQ